MPRTLLKIAQQALGEIGLPAPQTIVSNPDLTAIQCLALLQREGEELVETEDGWPELRGEQVFNLVPGQEAYPFPDDMAYYVTETMWDRSRRWQTINVSAREWQMLRSGFTIGGPWTRFRLMDGQIHFDPVPANTDTIAVEYASRNFCASSEGALQDSWQADTDVPRISDKLFVLGLKWRMLAAKGLNYAEERDAYDKAVDRTKARSHGSSALNLGQRGGRFGALGTPAIQPGDWPSA